MPQSPKKIALFGSTGSIGKQVLEVIAAYPEYFKATILVGNTNSSLLLAQATRFRPEIVAVENKQSAEVLRKNLPNTIQVLQGKESLQRLAAEGDYNIMLAAIIGCVALPYISLAIRSGKTIALANKEAMVVAGDILMKQAKKYKASIVPVDSEHAAIFQCLLGEEKNYDRILSSITLTASGGPFRGKGNNFLENVRPIHALNHPVWNMGPKISIDSATLMNKGLELMEARWLFNLPPYKLQALVHPEAIVHCAVAFIDGSVKMQLANSDMRIPIMNALSFPHKLCNPFGDNLSVMELETLRFERIEDRTFQCFALAKQVLMKDNLQFSCVLNAANEVSVAAFLHERIRFLDIAHAVEETLNKFVAHDIPELQLADIMEIDRATRLMTEKIITQLFED